MLHQRPHTGPRPCPQPWTLACPGCLTGNFLPQSSSQLDVNCLYTEAAFSSQNLNYRRKNTVQNHHPKQKRSTFRFGPCGVFWQMYHKIVMVLGKDTFRRCAGAKAIKQWCHVAMVFNMSSYRRYDDDTMSWRPWMASLPPPP